jgi:hypothetical protein
MQATLTRAAPLLAVLLVLAVLAMLILTARHGGHPVAATYFHD